MQHIPGLPGIETSERSQVDFWGFIAIPSIRSEYKVVNSTRPGTAIVLGNILKTTVPMKPQVVSMSIILNT